MRGKELVKKLTLLRCWMTYGRKLRFCLCSLFPLPLTRCRSSTKYQRFQVDLFFFVWFLTNFVLLYLNVSCCWIFFYFSFQHFPFLLLRKKNSHYVLTLRFLLLLFFVTFSRNRSWLLFYVLNALLYSLFENPFAARRTLWFSVKKCPPHEKGRKRKSHTEKRNEKENRCKCYFRSISV